MPAVFLAFLLFTFYLNSSPSLPHFAFLRQLLLLCNLWISTSLALQCARGPSVFISVFLGDSALLCVCPLIKSRCWLNLSCLVLTLPCPVLCSALSVWMEQCASTASLLASVREQERQFEMLSRALEEERRSCAGTLPRPLPNMQVTRKNNPILPHPPFSLTRTHVLHLDASSVISIPSLWTCWMAKLGEKIPPWWSLEFSSNFGS